MASARGSAIPLIVAGLATAFSLATYNRIEAVKEDIKTISGQDQSNGAVLVPDDLYFITTSEKTNGCIRNNSGATVCYNTTPFAVSGSYLQADLQVPTQMSSGAVLQMVSLECGNVPTAALSGTLAIHNAPIQGLSRGTVLKKSINVGAGGVTTVNTGAMLQTKVPDNQYVSFTGTGGKTITGAQFTVNDCVMNTVWRGKYGK